MKTYASRAEVNYSTRSDTDKCCGACRFLDTGGNAITCQRIESPHNRVIPQGICKLFRELEDESEDDENGDT